MDTRTALNNETVLRFKNSTVEYTIQNELARGGTSIVYNAFYTDNIGDKKLILIKECYPFKLDISRGSTGKLIPSESDIAKFEQAKERMQEAYKIENELFKTDGLTNSITNTYNLYKSNNTVYIVSEYSQGNVLSCNAINSLKEGISIVRSVAIAIQKIHNQGYLYLDIKPDNIFIFKETTDIVRFFDFDTLIPISNTKRNKGDYDYQISYTKGFAPLEQIEGNKKKIGKCSDVYGIGALLFYLIFNQAPNALDCDYDADYDFSSLTKFSVRMYQDKLFFKLKEFFHHTLAHYYLDRFQDMEGVIEKLDELISLSDTSIPFIYSSRISEPIFIVGRDKENDYLTEWFTQNAQNCLFIVGMGGIGKSTLMRYFIARNTKKFDTVLYVNYNMSIVRTIIDDIQIQINTIEQDEHESSNEYFKRKLEVIRELAIGKNIVLIIDNYTGEPVQDLSAILDINWNIILITRNKSLTEGYNALEIGPIQNNKTLYSLFENYLGRYLNKKEYLHLDNVIEKVAGHTFVLELIAKQVARSYISLEEASDFVEKHGFSNIAIEKVDYLKDSVTYHGTIKNIIYNLFDIAHLSEIKRTLLKIISLFGINGIDINILSDMLRLNSKDDLNELISENWIRIEDKHIFMHPVIIETMHQEEWTEDSKEKTVQVMDYLFVQIKSEAKREEYPKKPFKEMQFWKELSEHNERLNKHIQQSIQYISTKGVSGEIFSKRFEQCNVERTTDHWKLNIYLQMLESFLKECKKENSLFVSDKYNDLMYQTIINMPREREDFIYYTAEELVKDPSVHDKKNIRILIDLYSIIIGFYEEKGDFLTAKSKLDKAKSSLKYHNNFVSGEYYYLLARYYNTRIAGHCDIEMGEKEKYIKFFKHNINKAIQCMRKSRDLDSGKYLGKYYCFKAFVLIKEDIGNPNEIKVLLNKTKQLIERHEQSQTKLVRDYNMVCAWYYTYIEHDFIKVDDYISEAYGITFNISQTDFDKIDEMISIIKIYSEWGKYEDAISWIDLSIKLCKNHKNVLAYLRKEIELLKIWLDISYKKQDFEICKVIIRGIEEDAVMVGVNMEQIVPANIQKEIYS